MSHFFLNRFSTPFVMYGAYLAFTVTIPFLYSYASHKETSVVKRFKSASIAVEPAFINACSNSY